MRSERRELIAALEPLADRPTWLRVAAEREVSRAMGGSCSMPLAAFATLSGTQLSLRAAWGDAEGAGALVRAEGSAPAADLEQARSLGAEVAAKLRAGGAR